MKKVLCALAFLIILSCESGFEINLEVILKHTQELIKVESTYGDQEQGIVNLSWTWTFGKPAGDGIIIWRKIGAASDYDSIAYIDSIAEAMTFFYTSYSLTANIGVSYMLAMLRGKNAEHFDTTDFNMPPAHQIAQPDTEFLDLSNDTLEIVFSALSGFDTTDIAIYETSFNDVDSLLNASIDDILNSLTNSKVDTTITGTQLTITGADTLFLLNSVYVIKLSSSSMGSLDYITDTSIGIRAFSRIQ
jgi:hypothetical protein